MIDRYGILPYPSRHFTSWEDLEMPRLWRRTNGKFYAVWEDQGTRQKSLRTDDPKEAEKRFRSFKRDLLAGRVKPIARGAVIGFCAFVDEFLQHVAEDPNLARQTERLYADALVKARDLWGDVPLAHITSRHVERFMAELAKSGLKAPTVNKHFRHLKAAVRKGRKWYGIPGQIHFPAQIKERKNARYLTREQLVKIMGHIQEREFADLCLLSAYSGLRSGEILRLVSHDVDNPEGFLRVSADRKNGQEIRIPINSHMRGILSRRGAGKPGKLFSFRDQSEVSHRFKAAARSAGLAGVRFHDLRHSFGSHLAMQGVGLRTIQELMGHVSIQSTLVYAHLSPGHLQEASERLNYGPMPVKGNK